MSAVDVLAVLDAAIAGAEAPVRERRGHAISLMEARAAVAELVDADREYDDARLSGNAYRIAAAAARRRAALARVGGAA